GSAAGMEVVRRAGAGQVLDHSTPGYLDELAGITGGRGVSVVVEMLADVNLEQDLGVLAVGGRVVVVGSRGRLEFTPRLTMLKEATVMGTALWNATGAETDPALAAVAAELRSTARVPAVMGPPRWNAPGAETAAALAAVAAKLRSGALVRVVGEELPLGEAAAAHRPTLAAGAPGQRI